MPSKMSSKTREYSLQAHNKNNGSCIGGNKTISGSIPNSVHRISSDNEFVRIIPVQTDRHCIDIYYRRRVRVRKWKPWLGRYFDKHLTPEKLREALTSSNVRLTKYSIVQNPNFIIYQYHDKPLIAMDTTNGQFYTTSRAIEKYGLDAVQYQAYIIIEILKKNELSSAIRGKAKYLKGEVQC